MLPIAWLPMLPCRAWAVPGNESIPRFQKQPGRERHRRPFEKVRPKSFRHQSESALDHTFPAVFQAAFFSQATTKLGSAGGGASPPLFSRQPQRAFVQ
jgi:hypothetical protein